MMRSDLPKVLRFVVTRSPFIGVLAGCFLLASCATRLQEVERPPNQAALAPASSGDLAEMSRDVTGRFGADRSGFHLLTHNDEALLWRLALVDHATTSIDIQYYLWTGDDAGRLLLSRIIDAADRGVRVRILVDDFLLGGDEEGLAALCYHPNLEVRIFNPTTIRGGAIAPMLEWLVNFGELNRRMHNKAFIVDNRVAIMGGRNIGNPYFGLSKKYNFVDLDVLTSGAVVGDISDGFDEFWNSDPAFPGQLMSKKAGPGDTAGVIAEFRRDFSTQQNLLKKTIFPIEHQDWSARFRDVSSRWHSGTAIMLQDEPVTRLDEERQRFLDSAPRLADEVNPSELLVVSPYLIPGEMVYDSIKRNSAMGADVRMLTASLGSTNQPMVHSHFRKHRKSLIGNGADLYEFRHDPSEAIRDFSDTEPVRSKFVSIHAKTSTGDRRKCFIGSLNLDPRSIDINTENGLVIDSPSLARELAAHIDMLMATENAWRVTTTREGGKGFLRWESNGETKTIQPSPTFMKRVSDFIFGLLPIEGQL